MSVFTLKIGSEFRYKTSINRIYRVKDQNHVITENVETGEMMTLSMPELSNILSEQNAEDLKVLHGNLVMRAVPQLAFSKGNEVNKECIKLRYAKHIREYEQFAVSGLTVSRLVEEAAAKFGDLSPPSLRTVTRWLKRYDESESAKYRYRNRSKKPLSLSESKAITSLEKYYLDEAQETLADVYSRYSELSKIEEFKPVSISTFRRILNKEFSAFEITKARKGAAFAIKQLRATMKYQHPTRVYEVLELDHTVFDFVVVSADRMVVIGRPTLVCVTDVASKYIVAAHLTFQPPSVQTVMAALKMAILPKDMEDQKYSCLSEPWLGHGIPETIILDNGMENHSKAIQQFFVQTQMAINVEYSGRRRPYHKPHIEGFFSRAMGSLKTAHGRVKKHSDGDIRDLADASAVLTLNELRDHFYRWIEQVHNRRPNSRTRVVPREQFIEGMKNLPPLSIPLGPEYFDFFASPELTRQVAAGGIQFMQLTYGGAAVLELRKQYGESFRTKIRYNPEDLAAIYVLDPSTDMWLPALCSTLDYANSLSLAEHRSILRYRDRLFEESGKKAELNTLRVRLLEDTKKIVGKAKRMKTKNFKLLEQISNPAEVSHLHKLVNEQIEHIQHTNFSFDPDMWDDEAPIALEDI